MQIFTSDYDYHRDVAHHYREALKALTLTAVIRDQMQAVEFLGGMLKPLMTDEETESFRSVLKSAKGAAKANAEAAEAVVANNLRRVVSHVPQGNGDRPNGDGGATVTNPQPKPPIRPNDGAAVALPIPAKRDQRQTVKLDAGITF